MKLTREQRIKSLRQQIRDMLRERAPADAVRDLQDQLRELVRQNKVTKVWKGGLVQEMNQRFLDTINELINDGFRLDAIFLSSCYMKHLLRRATLKGITINPLRVDLSDKLKGGTVEKYLNDLEEAALRQLEEDIKINAKDNDLFSLADADA